MHWLQSNRFIALLILITVLCLAGFGYYGKSGIGRTELAKQEFDMALSEVQQFERIQPYPIEENRAAKKKAVDDFRKQVEALQAAFDSYRPGELKIVSPENFIDHLKELAKESKNEAELNNMKLPEQFFCGFEQYVTGTLPARGATGVLGYQLESIQDILLILAQSGATELINLHRPLIEEEKNQNYKPGPQDVARALPLEFTFRGPERSVRKFASALSANKERYWVIRSIRIGNTKKDPPKISDAKFTERRAADDEKKDIQFSDIFNQFEEAADPAPESPDSETPAPEPTPEAAPKPTVDEGEKILALVLGNEELTVHIRVDLLMFLEPKKLP